MDEHLNDIIREAARAGAAEGFGASFVESVVAKSGTKSEPAPILRLSRSRSFRLVAAAVLLVGILATLNSTRLRTAQAPAGQSLATRLPDGSSVVLAAGSSITYKSFFLRDRREVTLQGEAFFDVESRGKPFVVETFNSTVLVTGTRFNVRGWANDRIPETIVALEEGRVIVQALGTTSLATDLPQPIELMPGEAVRINSDGAKKDDRIVVAEALNWQRGGFSLVDVPLVDALTQISRRFAIRIDVDDSIVARLTTYVAPQTLSAEDALDAICFALDLRYRPILDGFRVESHTPDIQ